MISALIDLGLILAVVACVIHNRKTTSKVKALRDALIELGPAVDKFSEAVDSSQMSISEMRSTAEEVARQINEEARSARKKIDLLASTSYTPKMKIPASGKETLISQFFNHARGRS
jgi:uncharacterized protein YoxC